MEWTVSISLEANATSLSNNSYGHLHYLTLIPCLLEADNQPHNISFVTLSLTTISERVNSIFSVAKTKI